MPNIYETIDDVLRELRRRHFALEKTKLIQMMAKSGLHTPIDDQDLLDLINDLQLKRQNKYLENASKKLKSIQWKTSLAAARQKIGLPVNGISEEQARALHTALLETTSGVSKSVTIGTATKPALEIWTDVVREGRLLCRILMIDPGDADKIYASFSAGSVNWLLGVRKLLNPEGVLKIGGREIVYEPSTFDRLIGQLLWGLTLAPKDIVQAPSVGYRWERLPDGSGKFEETRFTPMQNTAAEDKALGNKLTEIKEFTRECALIQIRSDENLRGKMWSERWAIWTKVFPDFSYPTPDALRKAAARATKKHLKNLPTNPHAQSLKKSQPPLVSRDISIVNMTDIKAEKILRLFNEKAAILEGLNFFQNLADMSVSISGKQGDPIQIQRQGPDDTSIASVAQTMRFFMPDEETAIFTKISRMYSKLSAGQDLIDKVNAAHTALTTELIKPTPFKFNDVQLTYREICEFFLWSKLKDVDATKKANYDAWVQNPVFFACIWNEFACSLAKLSAVVFYIRDLNKDVLRQHRSKT